MVGDTYTIVDMAFWGWARMAPFVLGDDASAKYPNVKRLVDEISARPAAARAIALKDKFTFKAEMDDEARAHHVRPPQDQGGLIPALVWNCRACGPRKTGNLFSGLSHVGCALTLWVGLVSRPHARLQLVPK